MTALGLGIDIVELAELEQSVLARPRMMKRVFTAGELAYCDGNVERLAARFAAKEAAFKAVGTGWGRGVTWHDAEVVAKPRTRPALVVRGKLLARARKLGGETFQLSLTHSGSYAAAVVLLVTE